MKGLLVTTSTTPDDQQMARLVVLGEASLLTTALIKSNHHHHSYFYGRNLRHSISLPSRLASMAITADGDDLIDDLMEDATDGANATPALPTDPIIKSLIRLKAKLSKTGRCTYDVHSDPSYLIPFCEVVKNKDIDGPITGIALQSILKFVDCGFIASTESKGAACLISESVTKARFIGSDTSSDEVVLKRILDVLRELIVRGYKSLSNEAICEIMQSSLRIVFEKRLSELLRKSAERALEDMARSLFNRLDQLEDKPGWMESALSIKSSDGVKIPAGFGKDSSYRHQASNLDSMEINSGTTASGSGATASEATISPGKSSSEPHGIECVLELLHYTISLVNPLSEAQNSEGMINTGLNLLIIALESSVSAIAKKPSILHLIGSELCFYLIQLLQASRPLTSFALSLRLSFLVFTSLRPCLKYQMETFFIRLKEIVTTQNAPIEYRELSLEYLVAFFRHVTYLPHEIFFNYDLDPFASNLMDDLFQFFSKNCFSSSSPESNVYSASPFTPIQLLSLDALLATLNSLHRAEQRKDDFLVTIKEPCTSKKEQGAIQSTESSTSTSSSSSSKVKDTLGISSSHCPPRNYLSEPSQLVYMKLRKGLLETATKDFNDSPKKGVETLLKHSLAVDVKSIARFLRENQNLNKNLMGEFLAKKDNVDILNAFIESFELSGIRLDEALRIYLESFRLPGEAPLVANLLEPFAIHWHTCNGNPFENHDAAYTLSYAIIMLNVDQHNINAKKQNPAMTADQFVNNLRQVNGGKDFDRQMLLQIYHAIREREIVMPAEHDGPVRDKYLWKCLLKRSQSDTGRYLFAKQFVNPSDDDATNQEQPDNALHQLEQEGLEPIFSVSILNRQIFNTLWGPTVAAMTFIYDKINVDHHTSLTQRILCNGFNSCALLASSYGHLDNLIVILCKFTQSSSGIKPGSGPLPSHKTQLAAQTLFNIITEYANEMRESWSNIVEIILYWFKLGFLDGQFVVDDFALNVKVTIKKNSSVKSDKSMSESSGSLLSSFYNYFAGSDPEIHQPSTSSATTNEKTVDTVDDGNSQNTSVKQSSQVISELCQPFSIIEDSKFFHNDSLLELVKALINVNLELDGEDADDIEVLKLEMLLQIALLNRDRASRFWPQVSSYLLRVLRSTAVTCSQVLSERAISAIFRLAIRFIPRPDEMAEQVVDLLRKVLVTFEPCVIQKKCTAVALSSFITHCHPHIKRVDDWALVFDYLLCVGIGCHPSDLPVRRSPGAAKGETISSPSSSMASCASPSSCSIETPLLPEPPVPTVKIQIEQPICEAEGVKDSSRDGEEEAITPTAATATSTTTTSSTSNSSNSNFNAPDDIVQGTKTVTPELSQPFIPGNSSVRDVEAYLKCKDILTVVIKEILPKSCAIQANPSTDAEINQMAIDSLITLRFYSLHDESLRQQTGNSE